MEVLNADINNWAVLIGALMPFLVGLVTHSGASGNIKGVVLIVLNIVNGVLTDWFASPNGFDWEGAIFSSLAAFVTSVALYFGLYQKKISPALNAVTANVGIGAPRTGMRRAA